MRPRAKRRPRAVVHTIGIPADNLMQPVWARYHQGSRTGVYLLLMMPARLKRERRVQSGEMADRCGLPNGPNAGDCFRRACGMTPTAIRN